MSPTRSQKTKKQAQERILIVTNGHPDFSKGGVEMVAYGQFKELQKRQDCEVMLLSALPMGPAESGTRLSTRKPNEVLLSTLESDWFKFSQPHKPTVTWHFRELLETFRPTVVHFHHYVHLGIEILREARNYDPDLVIALTFHEFLALCNYNGQMVKRDTHKLCLDSNSSDCSACFPEHSPSDFFLRKLYIQSFFKLVDQFVSPSEFLMERYIEWGIPREKIRCMENGLAGVEYDQEASVKTRLSATAKKADSKRNEPASTPTDRRGATLIRHREERNKKNLKSKRIGFFGQINPFKGVDILLEALTLMRPSCQNQLSVSIHGGGLEIQPPDFQEKMQALLKQTEHRIQLVGPYEPRELPKLMGQIDWVIVPSIWWENSPVVIQEAYHYGHPVICSDIGGMKEKVIDGVTGIHFEAQNPQSLALILESIAEGEVSPQDFHANLPSPISFQTFALDHLEMYQGLRQR